MTTTEIIWVTIGAVGQTLYGARMIVQWWVSERQGRSVVPVSFWYLSLAAAVLMLAYALWRRDPVFISGQVLGLAIYLRNLSLLRPPGERAVETEVETGQPRAKAA